jgi:hypothetical protein
MAQKRHTHPAFPPQQWLSVTRALPALLNPTVSLILGFSRIERYTPVNTTCRLGCDARQQHVDHIWEEPTASTFNASSTKIVITQTV